jgi:small subunit ribosomal protein S18
MMEPVRRLCPLLLQTLSFPSFAALSLARQSSVATQATLSNDDRIDGESEHGLDGSRLIPRENDRNESERSNPRSSGTSHPKDLFSGLKLGRVSQSRIYYPGQSYETDDLAPRERFKSEMHTPTQKTRRVPMKGKDVDVGLLEMLDFRNARLLSQFVSETGKLLPRRKSGLSAKVHRKMVKRVKTSRIMGIIPFTERLSPTGVRKG